jgi:hypothetical protein
MRTTVPSVRTIVFICTLLISSISYSQSFISGNGKYEYGIGAGPLFFLGDLAGNAGEGKGFVKDVNLSQTKFVLGGFLNYYPAEWLGFRFALNYGRLQGDDALTKSNGGDERFRKERNLHFRSSLVEGYAALEISPTVFLEQYEDMKGKIRPYGIAGVGMFKFNPQGRYYDLATGGYKWVDLKPLRLEGQGMEEYPDRKEYKLMQMHIPMGFGVKYYVKENMYIGLEVMHRKTFTDYIDDVSTNYVDPNVFNKYLTPEQQPLANQLHYRENLSFNSPQARFDVGEQRGDPKENDSFFSSIMRFGWRLSDPNSPGSRSARQMRCPSFY